MPVRQMRVRVLATLALSVALVLGSAGAARASGVAVTDLTNGVTATQLAQSLAGAGVTISNVTYTGDNRAAGSFTNGSSSIGFDGGVVLSSGYVQTHAGDTACSQGVEGPNTCYEGSAGNSNDTQLGTPGDSSLNTLVSPSTTFDAAVLEFDFVPTQSTVHFSYVFSSEEYNDYANTQFNDVFAFFVNGTNCALVPGTSDPVSVNTINNGNPGGDATPHHPELFRDNVRPTPGTIDSQMDGLTTVLTCSATVNAGQANHMKLAIADTADNDLDSAVFLGAGSLVAGNNLTVTKNGTGAGTVTSAPAGINCGASCVATYPNGTGVTLTAVPASGSAFAGWSGGGCSGTGTCTVTMNSDTTVTATFNVLPPHTLTVVKGGTGSGSVSSSPAGISCGATCAASYTEGTAVTLTAVATSGSTFTGWSGGGCSGTGTCTVTLAADTTVTANFDTVPVVTPPPPVSGSGLFCGVQHRGKCKGIKVKTEFTGPGNAVWQFAAYNPPPGHQTASGAASKVVVLGSIKRHITKAGTVTIVFKLKHGAKTNKLYKKVHKLKLKAIRVVLKFTNAAGHVVTTTTSIKLKL